MGLKDAYAKAKEQGDAVKALSKQQDVHFHDDIPAAQEVETVHAAPNGQPAGPRWDYQTVVMNHGFMGFHKDELVRSEFESNLDTLGKQGFELAWVLLDQKLHGEKDGHVMIFKRPVQTL